MPGNSPNVYNPSPEPLEAENIHMDRIRGQHVIIDTEEGIYETETLGYPSEQGNGCKFSIVAEIALPVQGEGRHAMPELKHAVIVKAQKGDHITAYAIRGLYENDKGQMRMVPIPPVDIAPRKHVTLGSSGDTAELKQHDPSLVSAEDIWGPGVKFANEVDPIQLQVRAERSTLHLQDVSTHGTLVWAEFDQRGDYLFGHTSKSLKHARVNNLLDEQEKYAGYDLINRDTILGGPGFTSAVDIRNISANGEAILVAPDADPQPYDDLRNKMLEKIGEAKLGQTPHEALFRGVASVNGPEVSIARDEVKEIVALQAIYDAVHETLQYDPTYADAEMDKLVQEANKVGPLKKLANAALNSTVTLGHRIRNLSEYLRDGKGVCRHQGKAVAWLGGEATEMGLLPPSGRLTSDVSQRSMNPETGELERAAHDWGRYESPDGTVYILDPAQHFFGRLEDSISKNGWNYFRPGERETYMASRIQGIAK